jgi:hypothetical protein
MIHKPLLIASFVSLFLTTSALAQDALPEMELPPLPSETQQAPVSTQPTAPSIPDSGIGNVQIPEQPVVPNIEFGSPIPIKSDIKEPAKPKPPVAEAPIIEDIATDLPPLPGEDETPKKVVTIPEVSPAPANTEEKEEENSAELPPLPELPSAAEENQQTTDSTSPPPIPLPVPASEDEGESLFQRMFSFEKKKEQKALPKTEKKAAPVKKHSAPRKKYVKVTPPTTYRLPQQVYHKHYNRENKHLPEARYEGEYDAQLFAVAAMDDLRATRSLLATGRSVEMLSPTGEPLLIYAIRHHAVNVTRLLLAKGANPNTTDANGYNALYYAETSQNPQILTSLQEMGAKVGY